MTVLTRRDLDAASCQQPGCGCGGELVLHARCHPRAGTWAIYNQADGVLTIACARCNTLITRIQVADGAGVH